MKVVVLIKIVSIKFIESDVAVQSIKSHFVCTTLLLIVTIPLMSDSL